VADREGMMNAPLPRFNALEAMRDIERANSDHPNPALATLETLAVTHDVALPLRDKILNLTDDDWYEIEERSAIIEHDGGMPRFEAEARAIAEQLAKG